MAHIPACLALVAAPIVNKGLRSGQASSANVGADVVYARLSSEGCCKTLFHVWSL